MMHAITDAIYDSRTTAAFLRVPQRHYRRAPGAERSPQPPNDTLRAYRPIGSFLIRARDASSRALAGLGAALQAGGNRLIGTHPTKSL